MWIYSCLDTKVDRLCIKETNNKDLLLFRHKGRSFVYKRNGPKIGPCGTPYVISRGSEVLLLQLPCNILFPVCEIAFEPFEWRTPYPIEIKFMQKDLVVYCIVSNALLRSKKTLRTESFVLRWLQHQ